jgi:hypothetical protein
VRVILRADKADIRVNSCVIKQGAVVYLSGFAAAQPCWPTTATGMRQQQTAHVQHDIPLQDARTTRINMNK